MFLAIPAYLLFPKVYEKSVWITSEWVKDHCWKKRTGQKRGWWNSKHPTTQRRMSAMDARVISHWCHPSAWRRNDWVLFISFIAAESAGPRRMSRLRH